MIVTFLVDITGYNSKNKKIIQNPVLPSAIWPVCHGTDLPVPVPPEDIENVSRSDNEQTLDEEYQCPINSKEPKLLTLSELNDLVRDLGITKEKAKLFGSRLKEKNLLMEK